MFQLGQNLDQVFFFSLISAHSSTAVDILALITTDHSAVSLSADLFSFGLSTVPVAF